MKDFENKVAFITGAAHGQGRACALALAEEGADIAAFDVAKKIEYPAYEFGTSDELKSLKEEVEKLGRKCVICAGDVRDDKSVTAAVEKTIAELGKIDILFNNAGICAYAEVDKMTDDEWNAMIDINLKGPFNVTRRVVPYMKEKKSGVIINNSSVMGLRGGNRLSHYTASKWGLTGLTKAWAIELAPYNIRVVSIHPTGVNTPMNDGLAAMEGMTPIEIAERSAGNLLPVPWIEPEDVANLVKFLASDKARYATGSQFVIDAGLLSV
ncbi:MAG: mycofactocin-coupled SDR family oxidoreductase [Oscillospiraceae bacterium]|nr:mycofactocin-coupled SDR family oxidoreductase [Oscillospiraceae bacterium]MDD7353976.1 mycofactocin-coupled SDR family oxidoreductase [Oscillospiraceae bacterium]MDY3937965.1 mycofactocin-coupled SDR family oxidoreductase [Oscillospiraceae bacterium]